MRHLERINRILLLIRCIIRRIFYCPARKIPENISKIIVVPSGKLGDVVCNTPVLFAIRTHLPSARIIVVGTTKLHRPLLSDSGLVDDYINLEEKGALSQIKKHQAEVALVTGPSFVPTALLYLAGVPLVVAPRVEGGISPSETRPYKILQKFIKTFSYRMGEYAPRERLKALESLDIFSDNTKKVLGFSETAEKKAADMISGLPDTYKYLVGISAGAGNKEKQWDSKKFAKVANHLIKEHNAHIVVFGGENDILESSEMMSAILDKSRITDATSISIDDLKARISKLDVFISVNTGPIYIAEAFDIPTVDLVGPVSPWDQPPQGNIHKIVFPPGNPKPLLYVMNTRGHDVREAERIAQSTRIEDVITATEEALKEVDKRRTTKEE